MFTTATIVFFEFMYIMLLSGWRIASHLEKALFTRDVSFLPSEYQTDIDEDKLRTEFGFCSAVIDKDLPLEKFIEKFAALHPETRLLFPEVSYKSRELTFG